VEIRLIFPRIVLGFPTVKNNLSQDGAHNAPQDRKTDYSVHIPLIQLRIFTDFISSLIHRP
jgi:hypothetical protein